MEQSAHIHSTLIDGSFKKIHLPKESIFVTDIDLWPIYLNTFVGERETQYHNCHACRQFIQRYGGLVTIHHETGAITSAIWGAGKAPEGYSSTFMEMKVAVEKNSIAGVFYSSDELLGTPVTGEWTHFSAVNYIVHNKNYMTAGQLSAEKKEDYKNVSRALAEFKLETLEQVTELLQSDALYRSEKVLGQAEWLYNLKSLLVQQKNQQHRKNITWKAIADAPSGFCHPRSSMIGTLLDDLGNGLTFDVAAKRFESKMNPLQYQRPSALPNAGAILAAEKRVKDLGVEPSLERRYATLDDIEIIWKPKVIESSDRGGIFDHLKRGSIEPITANSGKITWMKFAASVLPKAKKIEINIGRRENFTTLVTALDISSPVIFQWGNHVSWYVWHGGSNASDYGLSVGWIDADAICFPPHAWSGENLTHFRQEPLFIIHGARESKNQGNAIFPETLKSEFHSIRSVIEAHSKSAKIHPIDGPHVVGLGLGSRIRVHTSVVTEYVIDRWE